ncbi:MAG: hypothetical protein JW910_02815 [Anaerolineae bacterium]|nr:hypothetical protein [Anaerolineae bacterium]
MWAKTFLRLLLTALILTLCGACAATAPATAPPPAPTATAVTWTGSGTRVVAFQQTPIPPTPSSGGSSVDPGVCLMPTTTAAIHYRVAATLDYSAHTVTVEQAVDYLNQSDQAMREIVFYVPPNAQPDVFTLDDLALGGYDETPPATLEGARLTVPLPVPLLPGCSQQITLVYTLRPPRMGSGYFPQQGYFGYEERQFNLGLWLATITHFTDGEWITPLPFNIGEQTVFPAATFEVALTVLNAPEDLIAVGPGTMRRDGNTWTFTLPAARDLSITLSDQYRRLSTDTANGVTVELYTLPDAQPPEDADYHAPRHALATAALALELYTDLYGSYPYERLVVVESAFRDGMEFSGLVFVGGEWFRSYDGDPAGYLTLITAHEVSHQWWYNLVANDQSAAPWLDEALAIYSEYIFLQENYPDLQSWWWDFRVNAFSPEGFVDATIYEFDSTRAYINAVYLRGARLMHGLRQDLGGEAFFTWLHDYCNATRGKVAAAADLWAALPPDALATTYATRAAFLRDPGPRE